MYIFQGILNLNSMDYTCMILKKGSMFLIKNKNNNNKQQNKQKKTINAILAEFPFSALAIYSSISNLHEEDIYFFSFWTAEDISFACV